MQATPELPPTRQPRRRRWLASLLILLCLPLLLVAAIVYANRPRWITYTSPPLTGTNLRLSVQMPDTWVPEKWYKFDTPDYKGFQLSFHQREPQGISKWLYERVFRVKTDSWIKDDFFYAIKIRNEDYKDIPALIKWVRVMKSSVHLPAIQSLHEYRFALGPALEWQYLFPPIWDTLMILPTETAPNNKALDVYVSFLGDPQHFKQAHSTLLEAADRVRITTVSPQLTPIRP